MLQRRIRAGGPVLLALFALASAGLGLGATADTLPARLSDAEFWQLSERLSEPDGAFQSDNLLSNELRYPEVIQELVARVRPGGVYLGVGPEQNFNYIAAIRPKMVFITDIRRGNLHLQLMYKALFELSADRGEFVARLFSKPRQPLKAAAPVGELMTAYWALESSPRAVFDRNLREIQDHLTKAPHRLPLSDADLDGIAGVYSSSTGTAPISYSSSSNNGFGRGNSTTYDDLMRAVDEAGVPRSYLATDESFRVMRDLEQRNMVVPVVGNFGGPKALRAIGQCVRAHAAAVSAFYLSNVERYLMQDFIWEKFCANVASMPLSDESTFIRSSNGGSRGFGGGFSNSLGMMRAETLECGTTAPGALTPAGR